MSQISTPRVNICIVDPARDLCVGCGRTLEEIAEWPKLSEEERQRIIATLHERLARLAASEKA